MRIIFRKYLPLLLVGIICLHNIDSWGFQQMRDTSKKEKTEKKVPKNTSFREELHRYMGYEKLMPKYISLPYDVIMNTNVQGSFIDIGYLLLLFLPILLFLGLRSLKLKLIVAMSFLSFYIISASTGYMAFKKIPLESVREIIKAELGAISFTSHPIAFIKLNVLQFSDRLYQPFDYIFNKISGNGDFFSYPLLLVLFFIGAFIINQCVFKKNKIDIVMVFFFYLYTFLWLILGVGVIWYGILLLPIGLLLFLIGYIKFKENLHIQNNWINFAFLLPTFIWIIIALTARFASYTPVDPLNSKGAISGVPLMYGLGKINKKQAVNSLYPNLDIVISKINADSDAQVYRAGTFLNYFITNNHERVLEDNQLGHFSRLIRKFPKKKYLTAAFKRSGYKYLLIDLNLATIDNTPEKSLKKKFNLLTDFLNNNPNIQFIGTDRMVLNPEGQVVFGLGDNIKKYGTFVAYEIK